MNRGCIRRILTAFAVVGVVGAGNASALRLSAWTSLRMEASTARSTENLQATLDISGRYSIGTWNDHGK